MVKYTKELSWKEHKINLEAFDIWAKANCGEHYCGNSANSSLKLHFLEEPSEDIILAIDVKWEELDDEDHEMCASYKSQEARKADVEAKAASGKAKLKILGLSDEEIAALMG